MFRLAAKAFLASPDTFAPSCVCVHVISGMCCITGWKDLHADRRTFENPPVAGLLSCWRPQKWHFRYEMAGSLSRQQSSHKSSPPTCSTSASKLLFVHSCNVTSHIPFFFLFFFFWAWQQIVDLSYYGWFKFNNKKAYESLFSVRLFEFSLHCQHFQLYVSHPMKCCNKIFQCQFSLNFMQPLILLHLTQLWIKAVFF